MWNKGNHIKNVNNLPDSNSPYYNEDNNNLFIKLVPKFDNKTIDGNFNNSYLNYSNNVKNNRKIPYIYYKSRTPKRKCRFHKTNSKKDNSQIITCNEQNNYIIQSLLNKNKYNNKSINIENSKNNSSSSKMSGIFNENNKNDYITLLTISNKNIVKNNQLKNIETPNDSSYQSNDFIKPQRKNNFLDGQKKEVNKNGRPALSKIINKNKNNKSYDFKIFKEQYGINKKKKNKRRNNTPNTLEDSVNNRKGTYIKKENDRGGKVILNKNYNYTAEKIIKKIILIQKMLRSYLSRKNNNILLKNRNNKNNKNNKYKNKSNENGIYYTDRLKDVNSSKNKNHNYTRVNLVPIHINQISLKDSEFKYVTNHYVYLKKSYLSKPNCENSNIYNNNINMNRNKRPLSYEIMAKRNVNLERRKLTPDFNRKVININSPFQITGENSLQIDNLKNRNERKNSNNSFNSNNNYDKYNNKNIKNNNNSDYNKASNLNDINYNDNYNLNKDNYSNLKTQNYNYINNENDNDNNNDNDFHEQNSNNINSDSYGYNKTNDIFHNEENNSNNIDSFNNNNNYNSHSSVNDNLNNSYNDNNKNNKRDLNNDIVKQEINIYKNQNNLNNLKNS